MTPFALLLMISGLSQREAAEFLNISASSVDKMSRGTRSAPPGVIDEMRGLIEKQETSAQSAVDKIRKILVKKDPPEMIQIVYPSDDAEAKSFGWPCVGAWCGMAARVIAASPIKISIVSAHEKSTTDPLLDLSSRSKRW